MKFVMYLTSKQEIQEVIPYKINQYPIVCNPYAQPKNDFKKRQIKKLKKLKMH